jgi:hypothetical protein
MKISLDDGKTWQEVSGVRIACEIPDPTDYEEDEETDAELLFTFTDEGLVTDVVLNGFVENSTSQTYIELGDEIINN